MRTNARNIGQDGIATAHCQQTTREDPSLTNLDVGGFSGEWCLVVLVLLVVGGDFLFSFFGLKKDEKGMDILDGTRHNE